MIGKIRLLPISIISVTDSSVMEAAKIKGQYSISYADAFAVTAALERRAVLVTGDPEYRVVTRLIKIQWLT